MSSSYKGIVLAGGVGSRLHPITIGLSKQLLPIYDKPMVYYPISVLMLAGIREILIVSAPEHINSYSKLLGDGRQFGVSFEFVTQSQPDGLAQAFLLGESFIADRNVALVLGDNVFYGHQFTDYLHNAAKYNEGATIFGYHVADPERFGVVELDGSNKVISIEEKPNQPKSNWAITGLYFYDNEVVEIAKSLAPSKRGELEITDVNNFYLNKGSLRVELFGRGFAWLDAGTPDTLLNAGRLVQTVEQRQGLKIACLEEIAYKQGWISKEYLVTQAKIYQDTSYGQYLNDLACDDR